MEQKIIFTNSKDDRLSAVITETNQEAPVVIICHGFTSWKEGSSKVIAENLQKLGFNTFRFDFWGHGESEGDFENITISEGVDDIHSAYKFLKEKGFKQFGLVGTSFGGGCAILAASRLEELEFLVLRSPVTDYLVKELMTKTKEEIAEWREKGYRIYKTNKGEEKKLSYRFFEDMKINSGFSVAGNIKAETYIVHGDQDDRVPHALSEMLVKLIPNSSLEIIPGADHVYSDPKLDESAIRKMLDFTRKFS